jgi:hypothetical protein
MVLRTGSANASLSPQSSALSTQVAWLSLDALDNDLTRFWVAIIAALTQICRYHAGVCAESCLKSALRICALMRLRRVPFLRRRWTTGLRKTTCDGWNSARRVGSPACNWPRWPCGSVPITPHLSRRLLAATVIWWTTSRRRYSIVKGWVQRFLRQAAVLPRKTAPLCAALTTANAHFGERRTGMPQMVPAGCLARRPL